MKPIHPFWSSERHQAYTEVALLVCAKGEEENLTPREIVRQLSPEAVNYVRQLPHAPDETFRDTFMYHLELDKVIIHDPLKRRDRLGEWGHVLVINFLEEWAGNP